MKLHVFNHRLVAKMMLSGRMHSMLLAIVVGAILWCASGAAMAAASCTYMNGNRPVTGTMPLQVTNITVGRDLPLGTMVYRQTMNTAEFIQVNCSGGPFTIAVETRLPVQPLPLSTWQPANEYAGKVYQTGVPGIGVAYWGQGVSPFKGENVPYCDATCPVSFKNITNFQMTLFKTGDVAPGTVSGANLPTVEGYMSIGDTSVLAYNMRMSGSINFVATTCSTPDVTVPMGTHKVSDLKAINTTTAWKDFSISLNNCPAFHGLYKQSGPSWEAGSGVNPGSSNKVVSMGTLNKNVLNMRIDAVGNAYDSAQGLLNLDGTAPGRLAAATGVAVQIGGPSKPIELAKIYSAGQTLQSNNASYSIALRARYLQTKAITTPGPANASATFTLIYQ